MKRPWLAALLNVLPIPRLPVICTGRLREKRAKSVENVYPRSVFSYSLPWSWLLARGWAVAARQPLPPLLHRLRPLLEPPLPRAPCRQ